MKYDRLYNFISPVTGKLSDYSQFPNLPEDYIIVGNKNNEAEVSPILIDIRLNMMDMRYDIDELQKNNIPDLSDAKFIIQTSDIRLPNAQALIDLDNGVLGNNEGVIEILQRVSGPTSSTDNNIARFDGVTGQLIKDSKVKIDDDGEIYANSLHVNNLIGKNTGFNASSLMLSDILYSLPTTSGTSGQVLTTPGIPGLTNSYQLYWSSVFTKPSDDNNSKPAYVPSNPIVIPIPVVIPLTATVTAPIPGTGIPIGSTIETPIKIDPLKGDIDTPGDINADNGHFDNDLDVDGDLSTQGDIESLGDISAEGNVSGDSFDFEDLSDLSDDFVRMEAPFDLDHSYKIELPDAEPILQEQIQPPDQRILQTAWRRMNPSANLKSLRLGKTADVMPVTKLTWTELEVQDPITINFVQATEDSNEKMIIGYNGESGFYPNIQEIVDISFGTFNNVNGIFDKFVSNSKEHIFTIKNSYYYKGLIRSNDYSISGINLLNRYDNGYSITTETDNLNNIYFNINHINNSFCSPILRYNHNINEFFTSSYIRGLDPVESFHFATKYYVDSQSSGGTLTQINTGTGLIGGPINISGTISLANTSVVSGNYRLANFSVNPQGQLINASNSTPQNTIVNTVCYFNDNNGSSLASGDVTINSNNISVFTANNSLNIKANGTGNINLQSNVRLQNGSSIDIYDNLNQFYIGFKAPQNIVNSIRWWLPINSGNPNQVLTTDGINGLSWSNKGVTSITATNGLTGGTITGTGTIGLSNTGVSSGTYTNPTFTVGLDGRITSASNGSSVNLGYYTFNGDSMTTSNYTMNIGNSNDVINMYGDLFTKNGFYLKKNPLIILQSSNFGSLYINNLGKLYYSYNNNSYYIAG